MDLLKTAVLQGRLESVRLLIDCRVESEVLPTKICDAVRLAISRKQKDITRFLLSKLSPEDWNLGFSRVASPLHLAVSSGDLDMMRVVVESCPDVSCRDFLMETALHIAVRKNSVYAATLLLDSGVEIDSFNYSGHTPLHLACTRGYSRVAKLLLERGASVDATTAISSATTLLTATKIRDADMIDLLLTHGADVNARDERGRSVLQVAIHLGDLKTVQQVLKRQPDVSRDSRALLRSVLREKGDHRDTLSALLDHGLTVDVNDVKCHQFLCDAVKRDYLRLVEQLLCQGADVDGEDINGRRPLLYAILKGAVDMVRLLVSFGADIDAKTDASEGDSFLHVACLEGQGEIVRILLDSGANVNATNSDCWTPIEYAFRFHKDKHGIVHCCPYEVILHYIIKLKAANIWLNKRNMLYVSKINEDTDVGIFYKGCEEEIKRMKTERPNGAKVSIYNLLTDNVAALAYYARNPTLVNAWAYGRCANTFPMYAALIANNLRKALKMRDLIFACKESISFLTENQLPEIFIEKLLGYFQERDMRRLAAVLERKKVSNNNEFLQ